MRILVTDGNTRPSLAICRSLGSKGHEIIVGDCKGFSLASVSKYCKQKCIYPDPSRHADLFIQFLYDYIEYYNIDAVIPVTDITTLPVTEHIELLRKVCIVPFPDFQSVDRAADKVDIIKLAQSLDIDIPSSIIIDKKNNLDTNTISFEYPVVIKPARSRVKTDSGWLYTSVTYAHSPKDLKKQINAMHPEIFPVLVQERIHGPGLGIFMCYQQGKPVAAFSHKRIREKPPSGGVSVLRESTGLDPVALGFSEKLLETLHWNGVAMVEFKIDNRDNRPRLMEINGRFWGSLQLAIDAGVDFPAILIKSIHESIEQDYSYTTGIRTRWLWGDIDALMLRLFKSSSSLNLPINSPGKIQYLMDFLKLWQKDTYYEVLKLSDIRPWLLESYQWLSRMFHEALSK